MGAPHLMALSDAQKNHIKKLWDEGWSASQIAKDVSRMIGTHYTRNAVLGVLHRIRHADTGLSVTKRKQPTKPGHQPRTSPQARAKAAGTTPVVVEHPSWKTRPKDSPQFKKVASAVQTQFARQQAAPAPAKAAPSRPVRLPGNGQCKWPIGDPLLPGFCFCEQSRVEGEPYCDAHCRVAYVAWNPGGPGHLAAGRRA